MLVFFHEGAVFFLHKKKRKKEKSKDGEFKVERANVRNSVFHSFGFLPLEWQKNKNVSLSSVNDDFTFLVELTLKWWWNTDGIKLRCAALLIAVACCQTVSES